MRYNDDALDTIFAALAHPIRRAILVRLGRGDGTVGELAEPFDVSLMAVSKHLSALERAGLVRREPEGRYRRCHLQAEPLRAASAWLAQHARLWGSQLDSLEAYLAERGGGEDGA